MRQFASVYGVLEKVTTIEAADNACSKAKVTTTVKRRPGASPLLFGGFLMNLAAFVSLEDISDALPSYHEEVISVELDPVLKEAYGRLEDDVREALRQPRGDGVQLRYRDSIGRTVEGADHCRLFGAGEASSGMDQFPSRCLGTEIRRAHQAVARCHA